MLPLIRMTWTSNRRVLAWTSPLPALLLVMALSAQNAGDMREVLPAMLGIPCLLLLQFALSDLVQPIEGYVLALPVSRIQIVRAKYLASALALGLGLALPLGAGNLAHLAAPGHFPPLSGSVQGGLGLTGLALAWVILLLLPCLYRFGASRGLLAFALGLVALLTAAVAWKGLAGTAMAALDLAERALAQPAFALGLVLATAALAAASVTVSSWSYRAR